MKISTNWLKTLINKDIPVTEMAELLTASGLEVEGIEVSESVKGGLKGLVVGQILECGKHPDADRLSITRVDIGTGTALSIVCGAPNVAVNQKVIVATVGTKLYPTEGEPFEIKKSKIRGAASEGMICAEDEIGLGKSHAPARTAGARIRPAAIVHRAAGDLRTHGRCLCGTGSTGRTRGSPALRRMPGVSRAEVLS